MTHALPRLQTLAHEALTVDQVRIRPLRDDTGNEYGARPRVRQILASSFGSDRTTSGVVPKTEFTAGAWCSRAAAGGVTVMGLGATAAESLSNSWRKWEEA